MSEPRRHALNSDPCPARDSSPGAPHVADGFPPICAFCSARLHDFIVTIPTPAPPPDLPGEPAPPVIIWRDKPPTLSDAQRIVGGYVQRVRLNDDRIMLVDEDGGPKRLHRNPAASELAGCTITGPALILEGAARKGWNR